MLFVLKLENKKVINVSKWLTESNLYISCQLGKHVKISFRLCLVPRKFEGKYKGKKIQKKNRRKEKVKENKQNRLKVDKLFFLLL